MNLKTLASVLEKSLEKNGEKPLTNKWLLNLIRMAERKEQHDLMYDHLSLYSIEDTF